GTREGRRGTFGGLSLASRIRTASDRTGARGLEAGSLQVRRQRLPHGRTKHRFRFPSPTRARGELFLAAHMPGRAARSALLPGTIRSLAMSHSDRHHPPGPASSPISRALPPRAKIVLSVVRGT